MKTKKKHEGNNDNEQIKSLFAEFSEHDSLSSLFNFIAQNSDLLHKTLQESLLLIQSDEEKEILKALTPLVLIFLIEQATGGTPNDFLFIFDMIYENSPSEQIESYIEVKLPETQIDD